MSNDLSWLVGELRALAGDLNANDTPPLVIAIDQGGHATRALAFDTQGQQIAESFVPISTFRSGDARVEHDAAEVAASMQTALNDLNQALGVDADRVVAAGIATQRSSIASWSLRTHAPLGPVLSWQDRRNAAFVATLQAHEPEIREITGLVLSPHYGASKMRWCLEHNPKLQDSAQKHRRALGPLAAWLLHANIHGHSQVVDAVNAARTQLLDIRTCDWSEQMLDLFGVARELLPAVVPNRYPYGQVRFAERLIPLVVCTGDQSAMPFAHGRPDPDTIYLNIGTGAFVQRIASTVEPPEGLLASVLWHGDAGTLRAIEGTVNGAGSALDWLSERIASDTTIDSTAWVHRVANTLTRASVAGIEPPLFLNGVSGVGSPYWRAGFESRFVGEGDDHERLIAVVESIAFLICVNIERMREGATRILASGGLANSDYLCECVATLSGLCVERSHLQEATATGLAYLVANEPQAWRPDARVDRFTPVDDPSLAARYARWRVAFAEAGA